MAVVFLALGVFLAAEATAVQQATPVARQRVGEIRVLGNPRTSSKAILKLVPFQPGQNLPTRRELRAAEQR